MPCRTLACLWPHPPDHQLEDDKAERDLDQGPPGPTHEQIARVAEGHHTDAKPKLQLNLLVCSTGSRTVSFAMIPPVVSKRIDKGVTSNTLRQRGWQPVLAAPDPSASFSLRMSRIIVVALLRVLRVHAAAAVVAVAFAICLEGAAHRCRVFSLHCLFCLSLLSFLPHFSPSASSAKLWVSSTLSSSRACSAALPAAARFVDRPQVWSARCPHGSTKRSSTTLCVYSTHHFLRAMNSLPSPLQRISPALSSLLLHCALSEPQLLFLLFAPSEP